MRELYGVAPRPDLQVVVVTCTKVTSTYIKNKLAGPSSVLRSGQWYWWFTYFKVFIDNLWNDSDSDVNIYRKILFGFFDEINPSLMI